MYKKYINKHIGLRIQKFLSYLDSHSFESFFLTQSHIHIHVFPDSSLCVLVIDPFLSVLHGCL